MQTLIRLSTSAEPVLQIFLAVRSASSKGGGGPQPRRPEEILDKSAYQEAVAGWGTPPLLKMNIPATQLLVGIPNYLGSFSGRHLSTACLGLSQQRPGEVFIV